MFHQLLKKRTKIVTTLGPVSSDKETIKKLLESGANIIRINFSHGEQVTHKKTIEIVREAALEVGKTVGILADIKGPKIRAEEFASDTQLFAGNTIRIQKTSILGTKDVFSVTYPGLIDDAYVGDLLLLDDGNLSMTVLEKDNEALLCKINNDSVMKSRKGIDLPGRVINIEFMSDKDRSDIAFAAENGADFIASSFVRNKDDIELVRDVLRSVGREDIPIISKIETKMALDNLDEIISHSDGCMVARGDLGIDLPIQEIPVAQKKIIRACNKVGKPVITATQMLESMISNPRPTRAEATDVANAILDGTDGIMLSGESAVGKYPVEAVKVMFEIASTIEGSIDYVQMLSDRMKEHDQLDSQKAFALGGTQIALEIGAKAIVTGTVSGKSAKIISKFRPNTHVIAVCSTEKVARSLTIYSGVTAVVGEFTNDLEQIINLASTIAIERLPLKKEDTILIIGGIPAQSGNTNFIKTVKISEVIRNVKL